MPRVQKYLCACRQWVAVHEKFCANCGKKNLKFTETAYEQQTKQPYFNAVQLLCKRDEHKETIAFLKKWNRTHRSKKRFCPRCNKEIIKPE